MKVVFFDADDTLWNISRCYASKQELISEFMEEKYKIDKYDVLDEIKKECRKYLADGNVTRHIFPTTCAQSCYKLIRHMDPMDILEVYKMAEQVFDVNPVPYKDTVSTLIELGQMGYSCIILTMGDYMVQSSKIFRTKLYNYVADSIIVPMKTTDVYLDLMKRYPMIDRYIMVGDSPIRDIEPAQRAGWTTVWINEEEGYNGWLDDRRAQVTEIKNVLKIIKGL